MTVTPDAAAQIHKLMDANPNKLGYVIICDDDGDGDGICDIVKANVMVMVMVMQLMLLGVMAVFVLGCLEEGVMDKHIQ